MFVRLKEPRIAFDQNHAPVQSGGICVNLELRIDNTTPRTSYSRIARPTVMGPKQNCDHKSPVNFRENVFLFASSTPVHLGMCYVEDLLGDRHTQCGLLSIASVAL